MTGYFKIFALAATAILLLPTAMLAGETNHKVLISDTVLVNGVRLAPGTYKLEWNQAGPRVQVIFQQDGKTVATAPATLKSHDKQITEDDLQTRTNSNNVKVLNEIDFGHQKEALIFPARG